MIFFWVHTCPQRDAVVEGTLDSLRESDVGAFSVWRHGPDITTSEEIEDWWETRLLAASKVPDFFVRLEDDVVVCRNIRHRVSRWGALQKPDFGVGLLYRWQGTNDSPTIIDRSGDFPRIVDYQHMGAPGMVFRSGIVPSLVRTMRHIRKTRIFSRFGKLNFDTIVGQACHELGFSVYLHEPSLVDCRETESVNQPGAMTHCPAANFAER
jgi:hypothetical protein